jgi:hypothetical protein
LDHRLSADPEKSEIYFFLLFAFAFVLRLYLFFRIGYTTDDALITFRYAENLASGNGFVYNLGERVLGTTTPLLTLLLAFFMKLKLSPFTSVFLIGIVADFFTARGIFRIFQTQQRPFSYLPSLLYLFNPETLQWSLSGMETQLYIAFAINALIFSVRDRWKSGFLFSAFAVLTRIDGIAVLGALTVAYLVRFRKLPLKEIILASFCLLPWMLFAFAYFGSPIPNSAGAKWALSGNNPLSAVFEILFKGFLHLHTFGVPFFLLAIYGTARIARADLRWIALPIWTWGYAFAYALAAGPMHPWYYPPFYAGYLILIFAGFYSLYERTAFLQKQVIITAGICSAIIIVLCLSYFRAQQLEKEQVHLNGVNKATGLWLKENALPGARIGIKDIGYIGYYSQRKVLDLAGLVSPECIPFRARNDFLGPIRKFQPEYFAFSGGQIRNLHLDQSDLLNMYTEVKKIENQYGTYIIYEKRAVFRSKG